jgi:gamma-glutamyltranspeptidase
VVAAGHYMAAQAGLQIIEAGAAVPLPAIIAAASTAALVAPNFDITENLFID